MSAIIHFGMPKTGSTSIRRAIFSHYQQTHGATLAYVGYKGQGMSASPLIRILYLSKSPSELASLRNKAGITPATLAQEKALANDFLRQSIANRGSRPLFVSSEIIPSIAAADLANFIGHFTAAECPVRGIGYIRDPKSYIESEFQQFVKTRPMRFELLRCFPKYRDMFEKFVTVFEKDQLDFIRFSPETFPQRCVVRDFLGRTDLQIPFGSAEHANESLSREATGLLYAYRLHATKEQHDALSFSPARNALLTQLQRLPGTKLRFHSSVIAPILHANRAHIEWMEKLLGEPLMMDLDQDDPIAVTSEQDLLSFSAPTLKWLSKRIADPCIAERVLSGGSLDVAIGVKWLFASIAQKRTERMAQSLKT